MRNRILVPFLALAALVLLVGLACGTTTEVTSEPPAQPTQEPPPTLPPPPTATEAAPAYFTEEFISSSLPYWSYFLTSGDESKVTAKSGGDRLTIELQGTDIYFYLLYDPYIYTDVRIDARATNRGMNTNNISFICRYNGTDWYEISISNGGLYWFYYGKWDKSGVTASYGVMTNGGTDNIRTGKATNDYTVTCIGNKISLYVNGQLEGSYVDRDYDLREGQVGINVSSLNVYPIIIDFDYVTISQP